MATAARGGRRFTLRRLGMWAACLLAGGLIAGELAARYIAGLGDPPLFMLDPDIEYLLQPNQHCRRFGHEFTVNSHSMRSDEFVTKKPAGELRVLVIGDSVVNGGGRVDQSELATAVAQHELAQQLKRPVVVANASAPSWGPPNELAFVKKFGLFDADVVVIVSNSDDWDDVPGLEYIGSAWPREKPLSALTELVGVYGWKAVCKALHRPAEPPPPARTATHEQDVEACRAAYGELIATIRRSGASVAVVQWMKRSELGGHAQPGFSAMHQWAIDAGVAPKETAKVLHDLLSSAPPADDPYQAGDDIHPSVSGQRVLARIVKEAVLEAIGPAQPTGQHPPAVP